MTEPYEEEQVSGNGQMAEAPGLLPASTDDLHRRTPRRYSIRQEVEDIWERLFNGDMEFRDLLDIKKIVEGNYRDELVCATRLVRDNSDTDSQLRIPMAQGGPGLTKIKQVLRDVLKDWGISHKQQESQLEALEA